MMQAQFEGKKAPKHQTAYAFRYRRTRKQTPDIKEQRSGKKESRALALGSNKKNVDAVRTPSTSGLKRKPILSEIWFQAKEEEVSSSSSLYLAGQQQGEPGP
jgi:hypothetical protein